MEFRAQVALSGRNAPASLSANTNDWAPTGVRQANRVDIQSSAAINLTGIDATLAPDGELKILTNVGSQVITLVAASASSAAANRFKIGTDFVLGPNQTVWLHYDVANSGWRLSAPASTTINSLAELVAVDPAADFLLLWDASTGTTVKAKPNNLGIAGGGGGSVTVKEIEVDFGTKPVYEATFPVTDASVSSTSKVVAQESGKTATGRTPGDAEWDSIICAARPAAGTFSLFCRALPGPVVGKRTIHYFIG